MNSRRSQDPACAERIARATSLIRALTGVVDAAIEADATGVRTVVVVVDPSMNAWEATRNVQSALLASLGMSIDTAIVEIRRGEKGTAQGREAGAAPAAGRAASAPRTPNGNGNGNGKAASNGKANGNGKAVSGNVNGKPHGKGTLNGNGQAGHSAQLPMPVVAPSARRPAGSVARVELESRLSGRVMCRVVVTTADRIAAGESEAADTPAGRLEAAARAVVAASPVPGIDLDGVRLVEVAGRKYVIAAVRRWGGRELVYRAEVAPVAASPEAAAAEAALGAILQ